MKNILFILLLVPLLLYAQNMHDLCKKRGHVWGDAIMTTSVYAEPYVIDTDSATILVYPPCNQKTYTCRRCSAECITLDAERREVIWQKEKLSPCDSLFLHKAKTDLIKMGIKNVW